MTDANMLTLWVLYDSPSDMPGYYVMRRYVVAPDGSQSSPEAYWSKAAVGLRDLMMERGLTCVPRSDSDEPHIVESWI
jgi:hypothetical protein